MKRLILPVAAAALFLSSACAPAAETAEPGPTITRTTVMTRPATNLPSTPGSVEPPVTITVTPSDTAKITVPSTKPPKAVVWPAPVAGDCPYVTDEEADLANGQRIGQTMLRETKPYAVCEFYRSDGGWSATISVTKAKDKAAAVALVDAAAPVKKSNPVEYQGGWTGGSWTKEVGEEPTIQNTYEMAVYAISKGNIAIVATSNEPLTKKAFNFVEAALANLDL